MRPETVAAPDPPVARCFKGSLWVKTLKQLTPVFLENKISAAALALENSSHLTG